MLIIHTYSFKFSVIPAVPSSSWRLRLHIKSQWDSPPFDAVARRNTSWLFKAKIAELEGSASLVGGKKLRKMKRTKHTDNTYTSN